MFGFITELIVNEVNWPPSRDSSADVSSVSPNEEPTFETSALRSLYGGQISALLMKHSFPLHTGAAL